MNRLLFIVFLQLVAISTLGQSVDRGRPDSSTGQPDALVRSLYRQVIARHPLGIPYGANWKVFAPYLSKGLSHRINLAHSCQDDWIRQNKGRVVKAPLAWAEAGLFSGANELADPLSFKLERTEPEQDGSFLAYVRLSGGSPPDKPWTWEVAARVVKEDGHAAIDDVIYLKGQEIDAEYRLSDVLATGCNGGRWVSDGKQ